MTTFLKSLVVLATLLASFREGNAKKGSISQIIVLMMENRSFDHILGYLKGVDGVTPDMSCPIDPNDESKGSVPIKSNGYDVSPDDPVHDLDSIALQMNGGAMNGFVLSQVLLDQNITNPVAMFDKSSAPILNTLAEEYAVFDKWFCSVPGPTDPNRQYAMSGTSRGATTNFNGTLYDQQTYIDYLREHGHSSGGYYQRDLWGLGAFEDLVNNPENVKNIKELDLHFYKDLAAGELPEFTWLQPSMTSLRRGHWPTWQHPDASIIEGERLIKQVYEAIRASPKWEETLFVVTYDEHGGFFDHVAPPTGVPSPDGIPCFDCDNGFDFTSLGVRVPTVAISPWISKGRVVSGGNGKPQPSSIFESTSVMATTNELLGVKAPPLGDRMAWAATFTHLLEENDKPRTDCPETLPELPDTPDDIVEVQRSKPINEHMEASLLFLCKQNYPEQFKEGVICAAALPHTQNQGTCSDWMHAEQAKYMARRQQQLGLL